MENAPPQPELIEKLLTGVYPSFCLLAGLQLGVFTSLSDGPLTGAEVATRLGVQKRILNPSSTHWPPQDYWKSMGIDSGTPRSLSNTSSRAD